MLTSIQPKRRSVFEIAIMSSEVFKELSDEFGVSVLYITHDLATAYYSADRIAVMLRGWIVEMGPVENVLGDPLHPYTQALLASTPSMTPVVV